MTTFAAQRMKIYTGHIMFFTFPTIYPGRDFSISIVYHVWYSVVSVAVHDTQ